MEEYKREIIQAAPELVFDSERFAVFGFDYGLAVAADNTKHFSTLGDLGMLPV